MSFIKLDQYPLDLVPFDNDLLSLEMESAFKVAKMLNNSYKGLFESVIFAMTSSVIFCF